MALAEEVCPACFAPATPRVVSPWNPAIDRYTCWCCGLTTLREDLVCNRHFSSTNGGGAPANTTPITPPPAPLVPPATIGAVITDLTLSPILGTSITIYWTSIGQTYGGFPLTYEIRYRIGATFANGDWATATNSSDIPLPSTIGQVDQSANPGLASATTYSFAIRIVDSNGARGPLSNIVTGTTP